VTQDIQKRLSQNNPYIGVFLSRKNDPKLHQSGHGSSVTSLSEIYATGALCQIYNILPGPNYSATLLLYPHKRITLKPDPVPPIAATDSDALFEQNIQNLLDISPKREIMPLIQETVDLLAEISTLNPLIKEQLSEFLRTLGLPQNSNLTPEQFETIPAKLADFAASMCDADPEDLQRVMETPEVEVRLECANRMLQEELTSAELQAEIRKDSEKLLSDRDRTNFLKSRLKSIQRELGMEILAKEKLLDKYRDRTKSLIIPAPAKKIIDDVRIFDPLFLK
jgi:ATP-dependent Lon protease